MSPRPEITSSEIAENITKLSDIEKPPTRQGIDLAAKMILPHLKADKQSLNDCVELASFRKAYPDSFRKLETIYQKLRTEKNAITKTASSGLNELRNSMNNEDESRTESYEKGTLTTFILKNFPLKFANTRDFAEKLYKLFQQGKTDAYQLSRKYPNVDLYDIYRKSVAFLLSQRATNSLDLVAHSPSEARALGQYFAYFYLNGADEIQPGYISTIIPNVRSLASLGISEDATGNYNLQTINQKYKDYVASMQGDNKTSLAGMINIDRDRSLEARWS